MRTPFIFSGQLLATPQSHGLVNAAGVLVP
jgi:hypothetical protein